MMLRILLVSVLSVAAISAQAELSLTNVMVSDVTSKSFTVSWQTSSPSAPRIEVFDTVSLDNDLSSNFEIEYYPLVGGNSSLPAGYDQEQYLADLTGSSQSESLSRVRVSGLSPDSEYYFRIESTSNEDSGSWPLLNGQLIKTEVENSFALDAVQLTVDVNQEASEGWVVFAAVEGGRYPVSAVLEDGADLGKATLNLANIFLEPNQNHGGGSNVSPNISVLNGSGELVTELFENIVLSNEFSVATNILVVMNDQSLPLPPVIEVTDSVVSYEGGSIEFAITVTDPNGTVPSLVIDAVPLGSEFTYDDTGEELGRGIFRWVPEVGQAGDYTINLVASDGELETTEAVAIKVNPANDKDGDTLPDTWELEYFGDLDQGSDGDSDQDGYSNIKEYEEGWSPIVKTVIPSVPQISSPIFDAEVSTASPQLVISNSTHSEDINVEYLFEVYSDVSMSTKVFEANVAEGVDQTSVVVEETIQGGSLLDNAMYYWRVRGTSSAGGRDWVTGQFFLNTANDAPSTPEIRYPVIGSSVSAYTPVLSVNNSTDVDRDQLKYSFKIYVSGSDTNLPPLMQIADLMPGADGFTAWQTPESLEEDTNYVWYAEVSDEHGLSRRTELASFFVSTRNDAPGIPLVSSPINLEEIASSTPALAWHKAVDPEGMTIQYNVHVNTNESFDDETNLTFVVPQGDEGIVQWNLTESLQDNTQYYWRVASTDGELFSDWSNGSFFVNTGNDAPPSPTLANPANESIVEVLQPSLSVNPVQDIDGDTLSYRFEVYSDEALSELVDSANVSNEQWMVSEPLGDNTNYYWRAQAEDEHGLVGLWSQVSHFFVNNQGVNDSPAFEFLLPAEDIELTDGEVLIQWADNDPDSAATISLWYETELGEIVQISEGISEDLDGEDDQYIWHVSGLETGIYKVGATIADEENTLTERSLYIVKVVPAVGVVESTLLTSAEIDEYGLNLARVDVVLDRAPIKDNTVTINIRVSDTTEAEIYDVQHLGESKAKNYLYFTSETWNSPVSIFIKGLDDCEVDGDRSVDLILESVASGDSGFDGVDPADVVLVNADNETSDQTLFICTYIDASQEISEDGASVDQTYIAQLKNTGGERLSPKATLTLLDSKYEVVGSNELSFPDVPANSSVDSLESFTIRRSIQTPESVASFQWDITSEPPKADLAVKLDGRNGRWSDGAFRFAAIVTNDGPSSAVDTLLMVLIPEGLIVGDIEGANCEINSTDISCSLGDLLPDTTKEVLITMETEDSRTKFDFEASVSSSVLDEDLENNNTANKYGGSYSLLFLMLLLLMLAYRKSQDPVRS